MRVGVIGLGSIGVRHCRNVKTLGHEIVYYDNDRWLHRGSLPEFWQEKPDCVLICTPPDSHVDLMHAAIDRGIPTFIEKPITIRHVNEVIYLSYLARQNGVITMVACNMRFHAGTATIKRWLQDEAIGKVLYGRFYAGSYLPAWVPSRDYKISYVAKTGIILDAGSHEVDLALWLLGPAKLKSAIWRPADTLGLMCDGLAELVLAHESGAISSVNLSFVEHGYRRGCEIIGTKGSIEWRDESESYMFKNEKGIVEDGAYYDQKEEQDAMYKAEIAEFLKCIEKGQQPCNPIGKAIDVLDVLLEARKEENKWGIPSA